MVVQCGEVLCCGARGTVCPRDPRLQASMTGSWAGAVLQPHLKLRGDARVSVKELKAEIVSAGCGGTVWGGVML